MGERRLVAVHPAWGIYLGGCEGGAISWWSADGRAANREAPSFADEAEAAEWFAGAEDQPWFAGMELRPAVADMSHGRVSPAALAAAGLGAFLGELAHAGWTAAPGRC